MGKHSATPVMQKFGRDTRKAIHSIMVTTEGLARNEHWGDIQAEINLDNLYEL